MAIRRLRLTLGVIALSSLVVAVTSTPSLDGAGATALKEVTSSTLAACTLDHAFAGWSDIQLINELVVVPVKLASVGSASAAARQGYGGVILFGWSAPSTLASQLAGLVSLVPRHNGMLVMTDDEGGQVWRAANLVAPTPWAKWMSSLGPAKIRSLAITAGHQMRAVGFNVDLAPVLDLDASTAVPGPSNADGLRSFSANPTVTSSDGIAFMQGLKSAGVLAVIKHFPGLGGVSPNTDYGPALTKSWSIVQGASLQPFTAAIAAGASALMVSNATVPGLTSGPASLSNAAITGVIRHQLGFKGLIMTDSLSGGAISLARYSVPAAAVAAIEAGADLVVFSVSGTTSAVGEANRVSQALMTAVSARRLSRARLEASAARVLEARGIHPCPSDTLVG